MLNKAAFTIYLIKNIIKQQYYGILLQFKTSVLFLKCSLFLWCKADLLAAITSVF